MKTTIKRGIEITYQAVKYNSIKIIAEIECELECETDDDVKKEAVKLTNLIDNIARKDLVRQCKRYWGKVPEPGSYKVDE